MAEVCFACPNCQESLEAPENTDQTYVVCPSCEASVMIPGKRVRRVIDREALQRSSERPEGPRIPPTTPVREDTLSPQPAGRGPRVGNIALLASALSLVLVGVLVFRSNRTPRPDSPPQEKGTELERANRNWDSGDRSGAVAGYKALVDGRTTSPELMKEEDALSIRTQLFARIIQYEFFSRNLDEAKRWSVLSANMGMKYEFDDPELNAFYRTSLARESPSR